jgi:CotS family spore coat protein
LDGSAMAVVNKQLNEIESVFDSYHISPHYRQFGSVFLAPSREPVFVLKPLKVGTVRAYLTGELLSQQELCPIIPHIVKTATGAYYRWQHGNRYLVTEKIPGRVADYHSDRDFKAAIIAMSSFHRFAGRVLQSNPKRWAILQFHPKFQWPKRIREMEICRERAIRFRDDPFSRQYLQMWHCFYELAFRVIQTLPRESPVAAPTICYHDWAFHNVLIQNGQAHLIDFDDMIVDHSIHDRVNLISRYLRLHQWANSALLKALWNFDRYYQWQKGELKLLGLYLAFPYEYWMLGRQYYIEKQPWSRSLYQEQWQRKISFFEERLKILDLIESME